MLYNSLYLILKIDSADFCLWNGEWCHFSTLNIWCRLTFSPCQRKTHWGLKAVNLASMPWISLWLLRRKAHDMFLNRKYRLNSSVYGITPDLLKTTYTREKKKERSICIIILIVDFSGCWDYGWFLLYFVDFWILQIFYRERVFYN